MKTKPKTQKPAAHVVKCADCREPMTVTDPHFRPADAYVCDRCMTAVGPDDRYHADSYPEQRL